MVKGEPGRYDERGLLGIAFRQTLKPTGNSMFITAYQLIRRQQPQSRISEFQVAANNHGYCEQNPAKQVVWKWEQPNQTTMAGIWFFGQWLFVHCLDGGGGGTNPQIIVAELIPLHYGRSSSWCNGNPYTVPKDNLSLTNRISGQK